MGKGYKGQDREDANVRRLKIAGARLEALGVGQPVVRSQRSGGEFYLAVQLSAAQAEMLAEMIEEARQV